MAENHPDDLEALLQDSQESQPEGLDSTGLAGEDPSSSLAAERPEHNSKSEPLQAQETAGPSKIPAAESAKRRTVKLSPLQQLLANEFDERQIGWRVYTPPSEPDEKVITHLQLAHHDMGDDMAWKEDLRLLSLNHVVPGPYTESWTKEANLFFRRLVIMNRRLEMYKKQKRA
jgi:hypothetical protein